MALRSTILPGSYAPPAGPDYGLASTANQFMTGQAVAPYRANLPGYDALVAQRSQNVGGLLRGEVPLDVRTQIQQSAAERGVAMGSPGSANANSAWLRALGLTSLGLQQEGSQQLGQAIEQTPVPEIWNPLSLYVPERLAAQELAAAQQGSGGGGSMSTPFTWRDPSRRSSYKFTTSGGGTY